LKVRRNINNTNRLFTAIKINYKDQLNSVACYVLKRKHEACRTTTLFLFRLKGVSLSWRNRHCVQSIGAKFYRGPDNL